MENVETQFFQLCSDVDSFCFESGEDLTGLQLAYETHGTLSADKDNAILLFHALSGSHHTAGCCKSISGVGTRWNEDCWNGWWNNFIGPGKALDTNKFFIICANYIGGCYGSTGPASINPKTDKPYGNLFPMITVGDIVESQISLVSHFGISRLHAVIGGSLGGILAMELAVRYPERVLNVIPIATAMDVSVLQRIYNLEQMFAIETDPNFNAGNYYDGTRPDRGLCLARMISHKTFVSLGVMEQRAKQEIVTDANTFHSYKVSLPIESYMLHQGAKFVKRFDANTYIRIVNAWQSVDFLRNRSEKSHEELFARCKDQRFLVFSIDSDVCFYPEEQTRLVGALKSAKVPVQHITVHSDKGHDAFLLEPDLFSPYISYVLAGNGF